MKTIKRILICCVIIFAIIFINGCYFVFYGQHKAANKLANNKDLNIYEVASTYTMHLAICTVGWIYGPEATKEYINMSFKKNRDKTIYVESDFFLTSPVVQKYAENIGPEEKRIAFKDDCYSLFNPNHRVALAANPGYLSKIGSTLYFRVPVHYPSCVNTKIYITKNKYILMNECLFNYLEKINVLHPHTIIYHSRCNK